MMVSSFRQSPYREPLRPRIGVTAPRHGIGTRVTRRYPGLLATTRPCRISPFPDVISANRSQRAWTSTPPALVVLVPITSHQTTAFPESPTGRRFGNGLDSNFCRAGFLGATVIRLSSGPLIRLPPRLLLPQRFRARQPWLLRPRISQFVTSLSRGYASRPCMGN
jgi:hypothetical protein